MTLKAFSRVTANMALTLDGRYAGLGFMYNRNLADLDGHVWEMMWMNPKAMKDRNEMEIDR